MSPAQNTKIELVTESIEALVLASVAVATEPNTDQRSIAYQNNVLDARTSLRAALKDLMTPTLRVLDGISAAA